jgi:hypothetical protein
MASIETVLRELSVAYGIYIVKNGIADTDNPQKFIEICEQAIVKDDVNELYYNLAKKIDSFTDDHIKIIKNGMKLAKIICSHDEFKDISAEPEIKWIGNSKELALIDITVDNYKFSLKENSNILNNMGLYQLINLLTDDNQKTGIHIFQSYAKDEHNQWFAFTWTKLLEYLDQHGCWHDVNDKNGTTSEITKNNNCIVFHYSDTIKNKFVSRTLPYNAQLTYDTYKKSTNAIIREKTLSKWIYQCLRNQKDYLQLKAKCSEQAGKNLVNYLQNHLSQNLSNLKKFLQILDYQYYYAKTNDDKQEIYKVPSEQEFNSIITISKIDYEVPKSQLNIITTIKNLETDHILQLRNELRHSHGQFNGIPEAKLYIHNSLDKSSLSTIYKPIYLTL